MTDTSRLAIKAEPGEDQTLRAAERTEQYGPDRRTAMCDTHHWGEIKQLFESQGSMRVFLTDLIGEPEVRYVADLVDVYIDDELNIGGKNLVAPWAAPGGDESWSESEWDRRTCETVYVIQNCIPIDPIPIESLRRQDGRFLNGESTDSAIVQEVTFVPGWEPPQHALSDDVLDGWLAVKTSANPTHIDEAAERTKRDGPDAETALVAPRVWRRAEQLRKKQGSARVYFVGGGHRGAQVKHVAELVKVSFGDAYETEGKEAPPAYGPSGDPGPEWSSGEGKTVYVIKNCVRVLSFPVDKLVKSDGDHASGENLQYTIVKEQKLTACGRPAGQRKSDVGPLESKTGQTSPTQGPGTRRERRLPGEQDLSTAAEGAAGWVLVNRYERNVGNRDKCIKAHDGPTCQVCEMTFAHVYGEHGAGFIHVHHVTPLSEVKKEHKPDPFNDLKPVCPNCHAMLHKKNAHGTWYDLEELKMIVKSCRSLSSGLSIVEDHSERKARASSLPPTGKA